LIEGPERLALGASKLLRNFGRSQPVSYRRLFTGENGQLGYANADSVMAILFPGVNRRTAATESGENKCRHDRFPRRMIPLDKSHAARRCSAICRTVRLKCSIVRMRLDRQLLVNQLCISSFGFLIRKKFL